MTALWVMPEGLFSLALMPFGLERFALLPMGWGIDVILWLARHVAALPAASIAVRAMPLWGLGVISSGLIWLCLRRGWWRLLGLLPLCVGLLTPWLCRPPDLLVSSDARLIALRVRQPDGARLMLEEGAGASPITLSDWGKSQAIEAPPLYMPEHGVDGSVACDAKLCRIALRGKLVLLLRDPGKRRHRLHRSGVAGLAGPGTPDLSRNRARRPLHGLARRGAGGLDRAERGDGSFRSRRSWHAALDPGPGQAAGSGAADGEDGMNAYRQEDEKWFRPVQSCVSPLSS
jgi:hypothetical protein